MLHRVRDLQLTHSDYNWLCKRKRAAINSLSEKAKFVDAPVLMDFRRATEENPEANCEYHNLMRLRTSAREHKVPVVRITAVHDGVSEDTAKKLEPEQFRGLEHTIEVAEHAKVIITHNLSVENGLMNGTFGEVKQIIFERGHHPNASTPAHRM